MDSVLLAIVKKNPKGFSSTTVRLIAPSLRTTATSSFDRTEIRMSSGIGLEGLGLVVLLDRTHFKGDEVDLSWSVVMDPRT